MSALPYEQWAENKVKVLRDEADFIERSLCEFRAFKKLTSESVAAVVSVHMLNEQEQLPANQGG
jgi:hypothetical protein